MNSTIKELFYGNINPNERSISNDSELKQLFSNSVVASEKLMAELNDHQKELFDNYTNKNGIANAESECSAFILGFRLGVKLVVEAMSGDIQ